MQLTKERVYRELIERKLMATEDTLPTSATRPINTTTTITASKNTSSNSNLTSSSPNRPKPNLNKPLTTAHSNSSITDTTTTTSSTSHSPTPIPPKINSESVEALVNRLYVKDGRVTLTSTTTSNTTTEAAAAAAFLKQYDLYKKKNNIPIDTKVFVMTGLYTCVKDDLIRRGWYHNSDPESPYFDLIWSLKSGMCKCK